MSVMFLCEIENLYLDIFQSIKRFYKGMVFFVNTLLNRCHGITKQTFIFEALLL